MNPILEQAELANPSLKYYRGRALAHVSSAWCPRPGSWTGPAWTDEQTNHYLNSYFFAYNEGQAFSRLADKVIESLGKAKAELLRCEKVYQEGLDEGPAARNMWGRERQLETARREVGRLTALSSALTVEINKQCHATS